MLAGHSASYFRTATQVELDLLLESPDKTIWAVEIKRVSAPKLGRGFYEDAKTLALL